MRQIYAANLCFGVCSAELVSSSACAAPYIDHFVDGSWFDRCTDDPFIEK